MGVSRRSSLLSKIEAPWSCWWKGGCMMRVKLVTVHARLALLFEAARNVGDPKQGPTRVRARRAFNGKRGGRQKTKQKRSCTRCFH
jgi:hypothetical protein